MDNLAQEEVIATIEQEEFDLSPPFPKVKSYTEAIELLEDIQKVEVV